MSIITIINVLSIVNISHLFLTYLRIKYIYNMLSIGNEWFARGPRQVIETGERDIV